MSAYPGDPRMNGFPWTMHYEQLRAMRTPVVLRRGGLGTGTFCRESTARSEAQTVDGEYVSGNFFTGLGVEPALGRMLRSVRTIGSAMAPRSPSSAGRYWSSRLASDSAIVGRQILVNSVPVTVVGVAAQRFAGTEVAVHPDVWVRVAIEPMVQQPSQLQADRLGVKVLARLKPDVSIEQAQAEMRILDRVWVEEMARRFKIPGWLQAHLDVEPAGAGKSVLREQLGRPLLALMAMVAVLLLLACVNIAGLLLARGAARNREMALRVAIGASRMRLWRQVLTESLLLSGAGGVLGVALAYGGAVALVRVLLSGRPMIGLPGARSRSTCSRISACCFLRPASRC